MNALGRKLLMWFLLGSIEDERIPDDQINDFARTMGFSSDKSPLFQHIFTRSQQVGILKHVKYPASYEMTEPHGAQFFVKFHAEYVDPDIPAEVLMDRIRQAVAVWEPQFP